MHFRSVLAATVVGGISPFIFETTTDRRCRRCRRQPASLITSHSSSTASIYRHAQNYTEHGGKRGDREHARCGIRHHLVQLVLPDIFLVFLNVHLRTCPGLGRRSNGEAQDIAYLLEISSAPQRCVRRVKCRRIYTRRCEKRHD